MTEWLAFTEQERKVTIEQAAQRSGLPVKAVEKDWWVTLTLRALFSCKYRASIVFKGGTSLSKWH